MQKIVLISGTIQKSVSMMGRGKLLPVTLVCCLNIFAILRVKSTAILYLTGFSLF